jgi:hypothetical protein
MSLMYMKTWEATDCSACGGKIENVMSPRGGRPRMFCETCHPKREINRTQDMHEYCATSWANYFTKKIRSGPEERAKQLSVADCISLIEKQNEKCALTGLKMTRVIGDPYAASPDCIVTRSQGGTYHKSNVQLVCTFANAMRGEMSLEDFRTLLEDLRKVPIST